MSALHLETSPECHDIIQQLWPIIFNDLTVRFLSICMFPVISLLSLLLLIKSGTRKELRSIIHPKDYLSAKERNQPRRSLVLNSWKEKLGIETRQDLLIFYSYGRCCYHINRSSVCRARIYCADAILGKAD